MPYPIRPLTEGMTPTPQTVAQAAMASASYEANRAGNEAMNRVFRAGGSIEAAQTAADTAYAAVMTHAAMCCAGREAA